MKKLPIYIIAAILLIALIFYVKTLFHHSGTIEANTVKIENGLIVDKNGSPLTGTILGTVDHAAEMVLPFWSLVAKEEGWNNLPFSKKFDFKNFRNYKKAYEGFSVHASVKDGKLSETTKVYFNLRKAKEEVLGNPISKNFKFYLGYLFKNQLKLAEANFNENRLNGEAIIYGGGSKKSFVKSVEFNFENNSTTSIKRYHKNGNLKRINHLNNNRKAGVQQEFSKDGVLSYEATYQDGKKVEEKSYYWKKDQLRKHTKFTEANTWIEKHYFPNGELSKEVNGRNRKEWYSNGNLKLEVTPDTSIYNHPKGKIETYHKNGSVYTVYNYDDLGKLNGHYEIYYKSGKLWETGSYKNNRKEGNLKKWYTNGQIAEDHLMVNGKINGAYVRYYDDGTRWKEFNYNNGSLNGPYKKWWKNGQLAYDCQYQNNRNTQCNKWNDKGESIK